MEDDQPRGSAFVFAGDWREFAPIAFTNLLLTIVTLGIYSFWAKARERRYLWSRTHFIDDQLEWTGTGLELLIGYAMAFVLLLLPIGLLQFTVQALVLRGHNGLAALLGFGLYLTIFYLVGVAIFRALRYRLSRTHWRGIRGGSNDNGFRYGVSHLWRMIAGGAVFGLLIPWAMVTLWNKRWNCLSFGPFAFRSDAQWGRLMTRFLLFYLLPILLFIGIAVLAGATGMFSARPASPDTALAAVLGIAVIGYFLFFIVLGLVALIYYAAYFREVVGQLSLGDGLTFGFDARTRDWVLLLIGNMALVVLTLGIGMIFIGYRNWSFFVRHLHAYGELDVDAMHQSQTRAPGQGEGLLDAFDVGAI